MANVPGLIKEPASIGFKMANRIIVQIIGGHEDHELIRLKDMIDELSAIQSALSGVDKLISGLKKGGATYFRIAKIDYSSPAVFELEAVPLKRDYNITDEVSATFIRGLDDIQNDREPEEFDYSLIEAFGGIGKTVGKTTSEMSIRGNGSEISLRDGLSSHIKKIIGEDITYRGSVSGILEWVNIHAGANRFYLYPVSGAQRVECRFNKEDMEIAVNNVNRYLKVTGKVKYHRKASHPYAINVDEIEVFPHEGELPTFFDLRGIAPNATGNMSSVEFINKLRKDG